MITLSYDQLLGLVSSNVIQSLIAAFIAGLIGTSQKQWLIRILYGLLAFPPALFTVQVIWEVVTNQNWRYVLAMILVAIGVYVTGKDYGKEVKK